MHQDDHALKIWTDGSALKNPGGPSGLAGIIEYPEAMNKPLEEAFAEGYKASTNNRMELLAVIRALEYIKRRRAIWTSLGIHRFIIITDSLYVKNNHRYPSVWRKAGWLKVSGGPVENPDLWKDFLRLQSAEIEWHPGKTTEANKLVDKLAKEQAKGHPTRVDSGFYAGRVSKTLNKGPAALPFPANGQVATIRVYRSAPKGIGVHRQHKTFFDLYSPDTKEVGGKFYAYLKRPEASRHGVYRATFNSNSDYPVIESIEDAEIEIPES